MRSGGGVQLTVTRTAYNAACEKRPKAQVDAMMKALGIVIMEDEEAQKDDAASLVVCSKVEDTPVPTQFERSYQEDCVDCGARVWVAMSSPLGAEKVCMECATGRLERGDLDGRQQSDERTPEEGR